MHIWSPGRLARYEAMQYYLFSIRYLQSLVRMGQNETNVQMMCNIFTAALVYQEMQRLAPDLESIHIESFNLKPKSLGNLILKSITLRCRLEISVQITCH